MNMHKKNTVADVSVIIPVYNSGKTVVRAVESIAKQTLLPKEVILVDDCSPDETTRDILIRLKNEYSRFFNIQLVFLKINGGPGDARNAGWELATGKYIAFLDSDDVWHPQKMEIQYNYMEKHEDVYFSCHHMAVIREEDIDSFSEENVTLDEINIIKINPLRYLFKHYPKGGTSFVVVRNVRELRFHPHKRYSEDYLLWLEYCFQYKGILLNTVLAASFKAVYGEGGLSFQLWRLEKGELEAYKLLQEKGCINLYMRRLASVFSLVKYGRRVLICMRRKYKV